MTHRNKHPLTAQAARPGAAVAYAVPAALLLVVVLLITLRNGAGIGFA